jgi:heptosyltransferase II
MAKIPDSISNALFISMGGIGNMVLLTPAVKAFHDRYPGARLHFLIPQNGARQLIEHHPLIGTIVEIEPGSQSLFSLIATLRKIRPDMVIAANGTNPLKCGLLGIGSGARYRLGELFKAGRLLYNIKVPFVPKMHETQANNALIARLGADTENISPTVWTTDDDRRKAETFLREQIGGRPWVGFHLGSGPAMTYKRWDTDRFILVGRRLTDRFNCTIVIFGGPEEVHMAREVCEEIGNGAVCAAGKLSIRQSFCAMRHASLFISNDSGPMHLAAAAGVPVIAIFGPTMDYKTSPLGDATIITAPVSCRPCYDYRQVTCTSRECLDGITVGQVTIAAEAVLLNAHGR